MNLESLFTQLFGAPSTVTALSPGRVNLIGEHTDYNEGLVLPTPIVQSCTVLMASTEREEVQIHSVQMSTSSQPLEMYSLGTERAGRDWLDYVQGVTEVLRLDGHLIGGFNAVVSSDVPPGSGLSSSASFMVATLRGLRELFALTLNDVEIAQLAQRAENGLVGARVGLMDQMACSLGRSGEALLIDFKTLAYRSVPLPETIELVVLHSGLSHSHAGHDGGTRNYRTRRLECERACELLGIKSLRELTITDLERINALPVPLRGRARHVVTENARVLEAVAALETGNLARVGELFYASHISMRDDYEVSEPEIDLIVELARATPGIYGSVVMLALKGMGRAAGEKIALEYAAQSGRTPRLLSPPATK
jgi:galactokinase